MKEIIKKKIPESIYNCLARHPEDPAHSVFYIIDGSIYVHTKFYVEEENPSLTLLHDIAYIEGVMLKELKGEDAVYIDEDDNLFFDLYVLALWFFDRIPSKDWRDLMGFLRLLREHENMCDYVAIESAGENTVH